MEFLKTYSIFNHFFFKRSSFNRGNCSNEFPNHINYKDSIRINKRKCANFNLEITIIDMSNPEIELDLVNFMKVKEENDSEKYRQKHHSMSFKLQFVQEIEAMELSTLVAQRKFGIQVYSTIMDWLRKFGKFNWETQTPLNIAKVQQQKLMKLEQQIRLLKKGTAILEQQVEQVKKKTIFFNIIVDIIEQEYKIPIRKNSHPINRIL